MKRLRVGTRVKINMPIVENGRTFDKGRIKSIDGEYYMILVEYDGKHAADYPDGILVERYLCELEEIK